MFRDEIPIMYQTLYITEKHENLPFIVCRLNVRLGCNLELGFLLGQYSEVNRSLALLALLAIG